MTIRDIVDDLTEDGTDVSLAAAKEIQNLRAKLERAEWSNNVTRLLMPPTRQVADMLRRTLIKMENGDYGRVETALCIFDTGIGIECFHWGEERKRSQLLGLCALLHANLLEA